MVLPQHDPNPYDFVPFEPEASRATSSASIARATGLTGRIEFSIKTLTPVCILQDPPSKDPGDPDRVYPFAYVGQQRVIPASSFKGMLRSVHETVTNSAMGIVTKNEKYLKKHAFNLTSFPSSYLPVAAPANPTPSEALFGFASDDKNHPSRAGRVFIDDIPIAPKQVTDTLRLPRPWGGPKPGHHPFYFIGEAPYLFALGRKFYYHHLPDLAPYPSVTVEAVKADLTVTGGVIRFINLDRSELASLVYALVLEEPLAHKLGYAKPYGFGSLRIHIDTLLLEDRNGGVPARYQSLDEPNMRDWTGWVTALRDRARVAWTERPKGAQSHGAFSAILRWQKEERYRYPNEEWFNDEDNKQTTLAEYQERDTLHPEPPRPPARTPEQPVFQSPSNPPEEIAATATVDKPANDAPAAKGKLRARLQVKGTYPPFVVVEKKQHRLDAQSASAEVVADLTARVERDEKPRIRFDARREHIGGKYAYVLRNVSLAEENG